MVMYMIFLFSESSEFLAKIKNSSEKEALRQRDNFKFCGTEIKTKVNNELQIRVPEEKSLIIQNISRMMGKGGSRNL